ncbi:hypothetical protein ACYT85_08145 [Ralstonia solanacearum]
MTLNHLPPVFCWTKMGTESGEDLSTIIMRKEWERRLGGGRFLWGIGQSLGNNAAVAANQVGALAAVFSPMPSKPKAIDVKPSEVVLWNAWLDGNGRMHPLPPHTFVTSRATLPSGKKKTFHYALVCMSPTVLKGHSGLSVYPDSLRNLSTGKGLGASQVTAVVDCVEPTNGEHAKSYPVAFTVELEAPYFVRLAQPTVLEPRDLVEVAETSRDGNFDSWKKLVKRLRNEQPTQRAHAFTPDLFHAPVNDSITHSLAKSSALTSASTPDCA